MKTQIQPWGKHEKASLAPQGNTVLQLPKRLFIQPGTFLGGDSIATSQGCCCPWHPGMPLPRTNSGSGGVGFHWEGERVHPHASKWWMKICYWRLQGLREASEAGAAHAGSLLACAANWAWTANPDLFQWKKKSPLLLFFHTSQMFGTFKACINTSVLLHLKAYSAILQFIKKQRKTTLIVRPGKALCCFLLPCNSLWLKHSQSEGAAADSMGTSPTSALPRLHLCCDAWSLLMAY